jgi:hypothetical protein
VPSEYSFCRAKRSEFGKALECRSAFMEGFPQFVFRGIQDLFLPCGKRRPGAIDIKIQHRHGGLIRRAFAPPAPLGRAFQRKRYPPRTPLLENLCFKVQCITAPGDLP